MGNKQSDLWTAADGCFWPTQLLRRLVEIAHAEKVRIVSAEILPENRGMQRVCQKLGFKLRHSYSDGVVRAEYLID